MGKTVTMKDIAEALDISIVTVSKALSGKGGSSEKLQEDIINKAKELGYQNKIPQLEVSNENSYNIGILIADHFFSSNAFYAEMYRHIVKNITELGSTAILELVQEEHEENAILPDIITGSKVSGIILLGNFKEEYIKNILSSELPCIFLDSYSSIANTVSITGDNVTGMYILTEYLIKQGHKSFAFVGSVKSTSSIMDRYLGCKKALISYDLPEDLLLIEDRDEKGRFIEANIPSKLPDAFICNCDETAFYLIENLKEKGYNIPDDVSVVGFDDYIYSKLCNPELTTYKVNISEMSRTSVNLILRKIKNKPFINCRTIIAGKLVVRKSVKNLKLK